MTDTVIGIILAILALLFYFLPFVVAYQRRHAYKWVIFAINLFAFFGLPWVVCLVWAVWPSNKSLIDPVAGNLTGIGKRNSGDTLGSIEYGRERGYAEEANNDGILKGYKSKLD